MREYNSLEVVHVAESIRGGVATYLRHLLPLQRDRYGNEKVAVVVPDDQVQDLGDLKGVLVVGFCRSRHRLVSAWRARRELLRLLGKTSPGFAHLHSTFAGVSCRLMRGSIRKRVRFIYCSHGWAFLRGGRGRWLARAMERLLAHVTDVIVCVSEDEHHEAAHIGIAEHKLVIITNGLPDLPPVPDTEPSPGTSNALRLLFIGRTDRQKGLDVLLTALRLLHRPVTLDVYGASVLGDAKKFESPENVTFHGWQAPAAMAEALARCDVVVMPSRWEAFGFVALEAMRAGKPVVCSRVGGLRYLVTHGITGHLVTPGDPSALARALDALETESLVAMGIAGRKVFLDSFRIEILESQLAKVYESLDTPTGKLNVPNFG